MSRPVFRPYDQGQLSLLPASLEELIPSGHVVRVISSVIDKIDLTPLYNRYEGGGASSYHPRLLLKVLIYGYVNNVYSSRKLEEAVSTNIHYMWLAGMQRPDHHTINRFRGERLAPVLKPIFRQVVLLLADQGCLDLKCLYLDGTKLEANANRYTFVWGKAIKTSKARIARQLEELWDYAQGVAAEELQDTRPADFTPISAEQIEATITQIDEAIRDKPVSKKVKQKLGYARRNWPDKVERYEQQEAQLGERNSMSKTDPDATFMRMKEDHMLNGQLKAGYNVQVSTNSTYILHYSTHQSPTDSPTLADHLEGFAQSYDQHIEELVADAGYAGEQNYQLLEDQQISAYVKDQAYDRDRGKKGKRKKRAARTAFAGDKLHYNAEHNCLYCPMGQPMDFIGTKTRNRGAFQMTFQLYQARRCEGCPLRPGCHKQRADRIVEYNHNYQRLKRQARERLDTPTGQQHLKRRPVEVETVFAQWKQNKGFRRFMLRGTAKVNTEVGLLALAFNLAKYATQNALSSSLIILLIPVRSQEYHDRLSEPCLRSAA